MRRGRQAQKVIDHRSHALHPAFDAIASPIAVGDLIIANCAFGSGPKHFVALRPGADGAMEAAWRLEKNVPHIPSVIAVEGRACLWKEQGIVRCLRLNDGRVLWQERASGDTFGSPVVAGEKLFSVDRAGVVTVLALSDKFQVLARNALSEPCQSTPAIANGRMFIRTWEHLHAVGAAQ